MGGRIVKLVHRIIRFQDNTMNCRFYVNSDNWNLPGTVFYCNESRFLVILRSVKVSLNLCQLSCLCTLSRILLNRWFQRLRRFLGGVGGGGGRGGHIVVKKQKQNSNRSTLSKDDIDYTVQSLTSWRRTLPSTAGTVRVSLASRQSMPGKSVSTILR